MVQPDPSPNSPPAAFQLTVTLKMKSVRAEEIAQLQRMKIWVQILRAQTWELWSQHWTEGDRKMAGSGWSTYLWVSSKLSETLSQKWDGEWLKKSPDIQLWPPHMHAHMWTPSHERKYKQTCTHTWMNTYIKVHMYTYISVHICKHMHGAQTYAYIHVVHTWTHTHRCTHEYIHIHTWTHEHIHMLYFTL